MFCSGMRGADILPEIDADPPLASRQIERLDRLADIGLEIAEALLAQAKGEGPKVVEGDIALAYDRIARAVRMAVMLQSRLAQDARRAHETPAEPQPPSPVIARKDQVARIVRRIAQGDDRLDGYQVGWAGREARERLEHDDIYGQVMSQPVSDIVADICHDLGLNPDWARLADEAWAQDEMDSGHVGEPLQALLDEDDEDERVLPCERQRTGGESDREGDRSNAQRAGAGMDRAPPLAIPTLEDRLQALASDPATLAAAGRGCSPGADTG